MAQIQILLCKHFGGDVVDDTSPQLGGDLDCNSYDILFDDNTGIRDDSDNEQLTFQKHLQQLTTLK